MEQKPSPAPAVTPAALEDIPRPQVDPAPAPAQQPAPSLQASRDAYNLRPVKAVRLAGLAFQAATRLIESAAGQATVVPRLLRDVGVEAWRQQEVLERPTPVPLYPAAPVPPGRRPLPEAIENLARVEVPRAEGYRFETIQDFAKAYREGKTTPEAVARRALEAVQRSNAGSTPLRAVIHSDEAAVMAQARASTQRFQEGRPLSILDGVPFTVKDELDAQPYPTHVGTRFLGTQPAERDATPVARLRAAGALLLGKTNMHELGLGVTGHNPHHGVVRNPYHPGHHTGASSSGAGSAVAAGLGPLGVGADGGGSIRIPAGLCGVFGLKSTFGRVSEAGAAPLVWTMAHVGPLAASAMDLALAYAVMAGPDPLDPWSLLQSPVHLDGVGRLELKGLRLGVFTPWLQDAAPEVVKAVEGLLDGLQRQGASLQEVVIPDLEAMRVGHLVTISTEIAATQEANYRTHRHEYGLDTRMSLSLARALTGRDYVRAQRVRTRALAHFQQVFQQVDVLVSPTTASTAPPIMPDAVAQGESNLEVLTALMRYAFPGNFTGLPALSLPAGYDAKGLPVGCQLMANAWQEARLLQVALVTEGLVSRKAPQVSFRLLD